MKMRRRDQIIFPVILSGRLLQPRAVYVNNMCVTTFGSTRFGNILAVKAFDRKVYVHGTVLYIGVLLCTQPFPELDTRRRKPEALCMWYTSGQKCFRSSAYVAFRSEYTGVDHRKDAYKEYLLDFLPSICQVLTISKTSRDAPRNRIIKWEKLGFVFTTYFLKRLSSQKSGSL